MNYFRATDTPSTTRIQDPGLVGCCIYYDEGVDVFIEKKKQAVLATVVLTSLSCAEVDHGSASMVVLPSSACDGSIVQQWNVYPTRNDFKHRNS
eukprot:scaffold3224_cov170-Alexandrium_tamarense.AAC.1